MTDTFVVPDLGDLPQRFVTYCVQHAGDWFPIHPFDLFVDNDNVVYPRYKPRGFEHQLYAYDETCTIRKKAVVGGRQVEIPTFFAKVDDFFGSNSDSETDSDSDSDSDNDF